MNVNYVIEHVELLNEDAFTDLLHDIAVSSMEGQYRQSKAKRSQSVSLVCK